MEPVLRPIEVQDSPKGLNKYQAIVNIDNNELLAIASDKYKLVHHSTLIDILEEVFSNKAELSSYHVIDKAYNKRLIRLYVFEGLSYSIAEDDDISLGIRLTNSYDLSLSINISVMGYRWICKNGLFMGNAVYRLYAKHTVGFEPKEIYNRIPVAVEAFNKMSNRWTEWRHTEVPEPNKFLEECLTSKKYTTMALKALQNNKQATLWDLYLAITNVTTHDMEPYTALRKETSILKAFNSYGQEV